MHRPRLAPLSSRTPATDIAKWNPELESWRRVLIEIEQHRLRRAPRRWPRGYGIRWAYFKFWPDSVARATRARGRYVVAAGWAP